MDRRSQSTCSGKGAGTLCLSHYVTLRLFWPVRCWPCCLSPAAAVAVPNPAKTLKILRSPCGYPLSPVARWKKFLCGFPALYVQPSVQRSHFRSRSEERRVGKEKRETSGPMGKKHVEYDVE